MDAIRLQRQSSTDQGTFGTLTAPGFSCRTGELPWRDNQRGVSCIPPGRYRCEIRESPKFGRVYQVKDVPGRSFVLIHAGNLCGDKAAGWRSNVEGCILLGRYLGRLEISKGRRQRAVMVSRPAVRDLMEIMGGEPFELEVV